MEYTDNAVIFADIIGRGVNFGAYVGEAAILEQIEVLKEHFSIDENKVYLSGFCGAAGSTLQMAQAYPHMFAGLLVYIPQQDFSLRMNLYNVDILAFFTQKNMYMVFQTAGYSSIMTSCPSWYSFL